MTMSAGQVRLVLRHIRKLTVAQAADALTDRELLHRFAASGDESAFAALLSRHGPMVLRVGRRVLANNEDAEDVFQATFLLLARKAASIRWQESVVNWLYRVTYHLALRTRTATARRSAHESKVDQRAPADPLAEISLREAQTVLDEELARLPEKFRAPLILCCLEGATRDEAARQLGWSLATLKRRLEQARQRLRGRLSRRGLTLSALLTAAELGHATASAAIPATLETALRTVIADGPGVSAKVASLVNGATSAMMWSKAKVLALVLALSLCLAGVSAVCLQTSVGSGKPSSSALAALPVSDTEAVPQNPERTDLHGDPLPPGALARLGTTRFRHGSAVSFVAFSPDGKTLLSGGPDLNDNIIRFCDPLTGKELRRFKAEQDDQLFCLALSRDGKRLAVGGAIWNREKDFKRCGGVLIWDVSTGKLLRRFATLFPDPVIAIAFSPGGKSVAAGSKAPSIYLFDVATGKEVRQFQGRGGTLAFSPDGKLLASGVGELWPDPGDHSARLWEVATARELHRLQGHGNIVTAVAFAPDGKTLVTGSEDKTVRFWDPTTGKEQRRLEGAHGRALALAFAPDGKTMVVGCREGEHPLCLWETATLKKLHTFGGHNRSVGRVAFSPDGKQLATSGWYNHTVCVWDAATGKELRHGSGHQAPVDTLALLCDGRRVTVSTEDRTVRVWDSQGKELRRIEGPPGLFFCAAVSADGKWAAFGHLDKTIRLYDLADGKEVGRCKGHTDYLRTVVFAPDGKRLASGSDDKTVRIWDTTTAKEIKQFKHDDYFLTVLFSADGKLLVYGGLNAELRIWELASGKVLFKQDSPRSPLDSLALSPDGKLLAEGNCGRVQIWDVASGQHLLELQGRHADEGLSIHNRCSLAFSPDGRTLAAGGWDDRIRVWEVATWQERRRFLGHPGRISCIAFSPDGRILASGSQDTTVLLWDVTGRVESKAKPALLSAKELEAEWADLADANASRGYRAMSSLLTRPAQAVVLLKKKLSPIPTVVPEQVGKLLADLGSDRFAVRKKATDDLAKLGEAVEGALRKAQEGKPILEVRQRIDRLLEKLQGPDRLRSRRALEVLELLGTPEARSLLESLAKGAPQAWRTQEARAALLRFSN
jgi:RNA polymerase sigma factor (sigma-70 family)